MKPRNSFGLHAVVLCWVFAWIAGLSQAQITEFNGVEVPGVVIAHIAASNDYKYNSPSIVIMPNGDYVAAHDVTGNNAPTPNPTYVYRSTDQGLTWTKVSTVSNLIWANLYVHNGDLYLMGRNGSGFYIRKSTDAGSTWTNPTSSTTGMISNIPGSTFHTAPVAMVEYNGRLWRSIETRASGVSGSSAGVMSAPIGSDLLNAANWTFSNRILNQESWLPDNHFEDWIEGNVVIDRNGQLVNIMRVGVPRGDDEVAAIMRVQNPTTITFDSGGDIIDFNGGAKKFTIRYDPVSDRYWSLANIITPYNTDVTILPSSHRDILALVQSRDMRNWDVERIVVQDLSDQDNIGFQYVDWQFDGDDLIAASRTAYPDGLGGAIRFHDANFFTFHRIENYATTRPTQALVADTNNNQVMRYELTETNLWMPVGKFQLGNTFAGAALIKPMGLAKNDDGDVFIGEQTDGGRILRFDSAGNFLNVVAKEGVNFTGQPEGLTMGPDGMLYMSVAFGTNPADKIYRIDPASGATTLFIDTTFTGGTLENPRAIAFGDDGNLYVADREGDVFRRFDGTTGAFLGNLYSGNSPEGLTWDQFQNKLIATYRDDGAANIVELGTSGGANTVYNLSNIGRALGIVVIDGQTYWSDWDNNKIYKLKDTNQIATSVSGLNRPGHLLQVDPMPIGERSWTNTSASNWRDWDNWTYWSRPDTSDEIAVFGSAAGVTTYAYINAGENFTVKGLRFRNSQRYIIDGDGALTLEAYSGRCSIDVLDGSQWIRVNTTLNDATDVTVNDAADELSFRDTVDLNGNELVKRGAGKLTFNAGLVMHGGKLVTDGLSPITFNTASTGLHTLDGGIEFRPDENTPLEFGESFDLIDGQQYFGGQFFNALVLPTLDPALKWAGNNFFIDGIITIVASVAADANLDGVVNLSDLQILGDNWQSASADWTTGDFTGDGIVNLADLQVLGDHWGDIATDLAELAVTIPEPAGALLISVGVVWVLFRRRD
ncbi:MAG: hypothetical protein IT445_13715 [Phycisphaeraceae bacterium]|nr:hypothetical protein [Phycisphaeraceae bacterium]